MANGASCSQLALEAWFDDRLDEQQHSKVTAHLVTCQVCKALLSDLTEMGSLGWRLGNLVARMPLEHRRRRQALLRAAAVPAPPHKILRSGRLGGVLLVVLAVAVIVCDLPAECMGRRLEVAEPLRVTFAPRSARAAAPRGDRVSLGARDVRATDSATSEPHP
ncbi:MAG: hypothetical protein RIF41_36670 [Polyangiaceae bacterium]